MFKAVHSSHGKFKSIPSFFSSVENKAVDASAGSKEHATAQAKLYAEELEPGQDVQVGVMNVTTKEVEVLFTVQ